MLRRYLSVGLIGACILTAGLFGRGDNAGAQARLAAKGDPEIVPPAVNPAAVKAPSALPVREVVLFNSGVGYFQRSGEVEGDARVDLQFPATEINDLIKSLVIDDGKGKTVPLRYDSQEPIEKTLRSFGVDLSTNPSYGQILNQTRGEKVEITLGTNNSGLPATMTGEIVGMETQHKAGPAGTAGTDKEFLNILCAEGLRNVPLEQIQRVRFLNPIIEADLRRALTVVAGAHDSQKKAVRMNFKGEGKRNVKVGYVVENPIWKTSYRLVMDKDGKARLVGLATIENTSDEDWNDVNLTLVSGRPISFQMDMYPPLYIPRPTVEPELYASLRPPTYAGPMAMINPIGAMGGVGFGGFGGGFAGNGVANTLNPMQQQQILMNQQGMGQGGGGFNGQFGNLSGQFGGQGGFQGGQGGGQGGLSNNRYQNSVQNFDNNAGRLNYNEMQARKANNDPGKGGKPGEQAVPGKSQAAQIGSIVANIDSDLIDRALTAEELGNPTRFKLDERVTLPRQQSAQLPLFDQSVDASRVSIYNEKVHPKHPLLGMKIKNNTKQALMQGPITVYDQQQYAGDARVQDLQPNEERYVSYAIDTGTEIRPADIVAPAPEMTVSMVDGKLQVGYKLRQSRTYQILNRSTESRKVMIEQPIRVGWKLVAPEKALETTRDLYRFEVAVKPGENVKYTVTEELPRIDPLTITKQANVDRATTTLGLDVWMTSERTPEAEMDFELRDNQLQVSHKNRRTITYHFDNRVAEKRTITLEHNLRDFQQFVIDGKPDPKDQRGQKVKLELPAGKDGESTKCVQHVIVEESQGASFEPFALKVTRQTAPWGGPPAWAGSATAELLKSELGFEVMRLKFRQPDTLLNVRLDRGNVVTKTKIADKNSYFVLIPNGHVPLKLNLRHKVPAQNVSVVGMKPEFGDIYKVALKVAPGEKVTQDIVEESTVEATMPIATLSEDRFRELVADTRTPKEVVQVLTQTRAMLAKLAETNANLVEAGKQQKEVSEEMARLRANLEKLPPDSMLYKRYITKLDGQETAMEKIQADLVRLNADAKSQKAATDDFIAKMRVN